MGAKGKHKASRWFGLLPLSAADVSPAVPQACPKPRLRARKSKEEGGLDNHRSHSADVVSDCPV